MSQDIMDRYYRAAKRFAGQLGLEPGERGADGTEPQVGPEERKLRELISRTGHETEKLSAVYYDVTIEEDWIERIEAALPHLEAAIREDRQFIKTEGNVTPIERVRKVSRASVEHLSRHSEMITHVPDEGEDLIPDRLKVYENESNFAVYENRVLYMVLCYTRDFVDYRYFKIAQAWKESSSETEFRKEMRTEGGPITVEVRFSDGTDGLADVEKKNAAKLVRIEAIAAQVAVLLDMPLMKNVALAPMVTPPITRTNVLRMDTHFREVVALYDYLSGYTGDGFTAERHENSYSPFPPEMETEITETVMFLSYLNAKYGRNLSEELADRYREEEERRAAVERAFFEQRLQEILQRSENGGEITPEEYRQLILAEVARREQTEAQCESLRAETEAVRVGAANAGARADRLQDGIERCKADMATLRTQMSTERKQSSEYAEGLQNEINRLKSEIEAQKENIALQEARIIGLMEKLGIANPEDMTEKERFLELEREKDAFDRYFERNWGVAKRKIRRKILWRKKD